MKNFTLERTRHENNQETLQGDHEGKQDYNASITRHVRTNLWYVYFILFFSSTKRISILGL